jgi:hypothetical protein
VAKSEIKYFKLLKDSIVAEMQKTYPGIPDSIAEWKGQNIIDFQDELHRKQNEHISEKWFYIHMKSDNSKLPRIDILNFLSKYAGYKSWGDFVRQNSFSTSKKKSDKSNRVLYVVPLITVVILTIFYFVYNSYYSQEFTFCFYDNVSKQPIANSLIEITLLEHNQSDRNYLCDADGCFTLKTNKSKIRFVVKTPYYHTDTIVRRLNRFNRHETIKLRLDDYAVMIQYFSNSNVEDWLKRKANLDIMFSNNAKIYQVMGSTLGMEIYNKWEFINKLTLPTSGLRDIEILDSRYEDDKITHLCFRQNGKE